MNEQFTRPVIDRISIVLRPADGQTLEQITPFARLGAHVSIGRGLAVITACCDRDAIEELHQAESQVVLAESAMRRGVILDSEPSTAEQSSVVAESPYAEVRVINIDEWISTVKNARRYEWLRERNNVTDIDTCLCVARDDTVYFGHDLDKNVDDAMRLAQLQELQSCVD